MKENVNIGLKRGTVELIDHQDLWETNASETKKHLKELFGDMALDIQHIGSTSIKNIKAKPIIDIVVGIDDFNNLENIMDKLAKNDLVYIPFLPDDRVFIMGNKERTINTHHIHVVKYNEKTWNDYINFRDYLNYNIEEAKKYEKVKIKLANENKENRENYTKSKEKYIIEILVKAEKWKLKNSSN